MVRGKAQNFYRLAIQTPHAPIRRRFPVLRSCRSHDTVNRRPKLAAKVAVHTPVMGWRRYQHIHCAVRTCVVRASYASAVRQSQHQHHRTYILIIPISAAIHHHTRLPSSTRGGPSTLSSGSWWAGNQRGGRNQVRLRASAAIHLHHCTHSQPSSPCSHTANRSRSRSIFSVRSITILSATSRQVLIR